MNYNALDALLEKVKDRKIDIDDAVKVLNDQKLGNPSGFGSEHDVVPETYNYDEPYLKDHTVHDEQVIIGVTHGSLAINTFFNIFHNEGSVRLHRLHFVKPIIVQKDQQVDVWVKPDVKESEIDFKTLYRYAGSEKWELTATGRLKVPTAEELALIGHKVDIEKIKSSSRQHHDLTALYDTNPVVELGESFRTITQIYIDDKQSLARVDLSQIVSMDDHQYDLHPLITNSAFLAAAILLDQVLLKEGGHTDGYLPFGIKDVYFNKNHGALDQCWVLVRIEKYTEEIIVFDVDLITDDFIVAAHYRGCSLKRLHSTNNEEINPLPGKSEIQRHPRALTTNEHLGRKIQNYLIDELNSIHGSGRKINDLDSNLMALGLTSVNLVDLTTKIESDLNVELTPTLMFEYPNITELTVFFSREYEDAFLKYFDASATNRKRGSRQDVAASPIPAEWNDSQSANDFKVETVFKKPITDHAGDDIAVIGMNGRFAEASDVEAYWKNIYDGKDLTTEVPVDHWDFHPWFDEDMNAGDKTYCKWGSFIDDVDKFDAEFFSVSPREAQWMDPQVRLILQCIYSTIEDSGYINQIRGTDTGVFVGACLHDYSDKITELNLPLDPYIGTGNAQTVIANRASFIFNFTGPSIAVDTACSSSLFALHYACQALKNKECEMAFAGGVNLLLSSGHYRYFCSIGALSPTGRCHSFDKAADGYVPGECVAGILLKPLRKAIKDGDHIYAVVKGSAALHGGYTPSLTAPSVSGEENVILKAWDNAGINPETITYVEAHGTGTKLGDPIEIASLTKAFRRFTKKENFCAVGSVKANIGHTEGAAGIASIIKVIQQMRHKKTPRMPGFKTLNPYIKFTESPLYINQAAGDWVTPKNIPRRAGVSSFGFSGAYAHIVLEEFINKEIANTGYEHDIPNDSHVFILSAKNIEQLKIYVQNFVTFLNKDRDDKNRIRLAEIAYTSQVCREAMKERLAVIAESVEALSEKLAGFIADKEKIEDLYRGQAKGTKDALSGLNADKDLQETIEKWIEHRQLSKLSDLWVKGVDIDWKRLYGETLPRRVSLPAYPFAMQRHWLPEPDRSVPEAGTCGKNLHPLLHRNISNFYGQRFESVFTDGDSCLSDRIAKGEKVLPEAAHLEMACVAVGYAEERTAEERAAIQFEDVVWEQPIVVGEQPLRACTELLPEDDDRIVFTIHGLPEAGGNDEAIYSHGTVIPGASVKIPAVDVESIKAACDPTPVSAEQRGHLIEQIYTGAGYVLVKFLRQAAEMSPREAFTLNPGVLNCAVREAIWFAGGSSDKPFTLASARHITFSGECGSPAWALIKFRENDALEGGARSLDIHVCDEHGGVCVRMTHVSIEAFQNGTPHADAIRSEGLPDPAEPATGTIILTPVWEAMKVGKSHLYPGATARTVIVGGARDELDAVQRFFPSARALEIDEKDRVENIAQMLASYQAIEHIVWIASRDSIESVVDDRVVEAQHRAVMRFFRMIKALLASGYGTRPLVWSVITTQSQRIGGEDFVCPVHAGLHGIAGSMAKEYPGWKVRLVDLEADRDWPLAVLFTLPVDSSGDALACRKNEWYRRQLIPSDYPPADKITYRTGGVYVVIGGAGGIAEVWSEYMIRTYQARIVWIGRREENESIRKKIDALSGLGPAPMYIAADATRLNSLKRACEKVKLHYPEINGVIHSAVVLSDKSLMKMEEEQLSAAIAAKADVSVRLAQVFRKEPLDFVLFFSSMQSFVKAPGQSNYASGCTFSDAFAQQLSMEWTCAVKVINWGYWGNVGVVSSADYQERMAQNGIDAINPPEAMQTLEVLLSGHTDQIGLIKTTKPLAMGGMSADESIAVYPETIPATSQGVTRRIPVQRTQIKNLKNKWRPKMEAMDKWLCGMLWGQLRSLGLFSEKTVLPGEQKNKVALLHLYDRWFDESIEILSNSGYLTCDGASIRVNRTGPVDMKALWADHDQRKGSWMKDPDMKAYALLIDATLRALPEILTGKRAATDVMFPESSSGLVEGLYQNNPMADCFNEVVANAVAAHIQERIEQDPSARIRILEIGAGTGGTSAVVFSKITPYRKHIDQYCYTDISKAFLIQAEASYGAANPYLDFKSFDVAKPIIEQGIEAGGYDLVIAANVLHATENIRHSLRNTKAVLKKNGLMLLNEFSAKTLFTHLTFGLLRGWWLYEDPALRIHGCPGLSPEAWRSVLEAEGFKSVRFPMKKAHDLGQQIIIAESDGVVRQRRRSGARRAREAAIKPYDEQNVVSHGEQPECTGTEGISIRSIGENLKERLVQELSETLKVDPGNIESDQSFADYGLDSLLTAAFMTRIRDAFGVEINTATIFDYSTVAQLSDYLIKTYRKEIEEIFQPMQADAARVTVSLERVRKSPTIEKRRLPNKPTRLNYRTRSRSTALPKRLEIAVIGMSGQFPGAPDVAAFWRNIISGHDGIQELPKRYLDQDLYFSPEKQKGKSYCKWGGVLENRDCFDPLFFNISPREAESMNPHQRLILQESWRALEDAGCNPWVLSESQAGLFVGAEPTGYFHESFTGSSDAIVASRLSYFLNLKGPAMVVNTGCSSSGVAIHLACESLRCRESNLAIAGGVFAKMNKEDLVVLSDIEMLSPTGRCRTFDEAADGTVFAEGVGVVVLKRLDEAISHGDHIYGVIQASGINQDGASNGITAPNGLSQELLLKTVYKRFGINPEDITYIEAHGTGTKLGDPVEANALVRAFKHFTDKKEYCVVGSAKAHVGHMAAAAGIGGLIKTLLSLYHRRIPGLLHFKKLNPLIEFDGSPFYMNQEAAPWRPKNGKPLMAAVNSFGHSGTNVHLVVEEYIPPVVAPSPSMAHSGGNRPFLVPLSARTENRLKEYAARLLAFLQDSVGEGSGFPENGNEKDALRHSNRGSRRCVDLASIAFTLQTGRAAMRERAIFMVRDIPDLVHKLEAFTQGGKTISGFWRRRAGKDKSILKMFSQDEEFKKTVDNWIADGKAAKIAELWSHGFAVNWNLFHGQNTPQRISLPTYPFAGRRFWITQSEGKNGNGQAALPVDDFIHPLLHRNTSDFARQRFSTTLTGREFFLAGHLVTGRRVLPGVVYLEMARAAAARAAWGGEKRGAGIRLRNMVWSQPLVVENPPQNVHIELVPEADGRITFQISGDPGENDSEPVVHSQGIVELNATVSVPDLDLEALKSGHKQDILDPSFCYDALKAVGIEHGREMKCVEDLYLGPDSVLAKLTLPSVVSHLKDQFVLHPSMMDSALLGEIALIMAPAYVSQSSDRRPTRPAMPFFLKQLDVFGECTPSMWALIRFGAKSAGDSVRKLDVDLCDDQGRVRVKIKGYTSRTRHGGDARVAAASRGAVPDTASEPPVGDVKLTPMWIPAAIKPGVMRPSRTDRIAIVGEAGDHGAAVRQRYPEAREITWPSGAAIEIMADAFRRMEPVDHIVWIAPRDGLASPVDECLIGDQERGVITLFRLVKALLGMGYGARELGWTLITTQTQPVHKNDPVNPTHAGIHGLVGSMAKEYPKWRIRLVDLEADGDWPLDAIFALPPDPRGDALAYRDKQWLVQQLIPVECQPPGKVSYKTGGVYVVIGGAGGIGAAWSEYLIRNYGAHIVWIGRREKDEGVQRKIDRLAALGPAPHYITADATDRASLARAREEIKQLHPRINGVVHSALVLLDRSLANMDEPQFRAGLCAKVDTCVRMAQVFQKEPLDFLMFFSALMTFTKAPGQSNYASGCTFSDAYAREAGRQIPFSVKIVNWGYWGSTGVVSSRSYRDRMARAGVGSIEPPEAMAVLETLLAGQLDQIGYIKLIKSIDMPGWRSEDRITVQPETIPRVINDLKRHLPERGARVEEIQSKDNLHLEEMDTLLCGLLWGQLQSIGLFAEKRETLENLKTKTNLPDIFDKWLEQSVAFLAHHHHIVREGDTFHSNAAAPSDMDTLWRRWEKEKKSWLANPNKKAQVKLVETVVRALPDILTGKVPATDIIFPNSSLELVEGVYKNNRTSALYNEVLSDALVAYLEERLARHPSAAIKILEIGAGVGGTSNLVFEKIHPYRKSIETYCYTDISKAFLLHAEKNYASGNPYLTCKLFNVEKPIAGQGINPGEYDIVIAANVLHATRNIRQTLANAKAPLRRNGLLLLNEMSGVSLFAHLTFGLLEGWWLYEDEALRITGSPGLSSETWRSVLAGEGFGSVLFPAPETHVLGQQIIVAESDGIVRQQRPPGVEAAPIRKTTKANARPPKPGATVSQSFMEEDRIAKNKGDASIRRVGAVTDQMLEDHVTEIILGTLTEALKVDVEELDPDDSFMDYGVDSIIGVNMVNMINQALKIELETISLFEHSSIHRLTAHILSQNKDAIRAALGHHTGQTSTGDAAGIRLEKTASADCISNRFSKETAVDNAGTIQKKSVSGVSGQSVVAVTDQMVEDHVKETISGILSEALKVDGDDLDPDDSFMDYGVDSIIGVNMVKMINQALKIELETISLFEHSSIHQLTAHILSQNKDAIRAILGQNAGQTENDNAAGIRLEETAPAVCLPNRFAKKAMKADTPRIQERATRVATADKGSAQKDPVAIIGMSGRFATAGNTDELWEHLANGDDLVKAVTRWDFSPFYANDPEKKERFCRHGGLFDEIDMFDPFLFRISVREATYMDPQQRVFLEECWKAMEDAGYAGPDINGRRCGVYAGCFGGDYRNLFQEDPPAQAFWGNAGSVIPARIAYYLNLQGPAVAIDTACSSSLVAVHLACEGLWSGETEMALAGGVFIQCTPGFYIMANKSGMLSPSGRCRTFDSRADGFVPGEGAGVVVLKRLARAIDDGDHIYGVIRGSGVNQDGTSNGITAPSAGSQQRLIRRIYEEINVHPEQIQMVEAHGTGTELGDPIEFEALRKAFQKDTDQKGYCALGTIKSNIGHAGNAAGIAGLIKILLCLKNRKIAPSLHFRTANPNIRLKESPFYVNTRLKEWDVQPDRTRRAVVSAFGFSGTNAHLVIEEAPAVERRHPEIPGHLIVLSAQTDGQLRRQAENLVDYCEKTPMGDVGNMSYTLLLGRKHFNHRLACVAGNCRELSALLKRWLKKSKVSQVHASVLPETGHREQPALANFGNQCIEKCRDGNRSADFLEHLSTVAELYVQGYSLEYKQLFGGGRYSRIPLPAYPFQKRRCWIESGPEPAVIVPSPVAPTGVDNRSVIDHMSISDCVIDIVIHLLGMTEEEIKLDRPLDQYGFDSIIALSLLQQLQNRVNPGIDLVQLQKCGSIQDIIDALLKLGDAPQPVKNTTVPASATWPQFPELFRMNGNSHGRPVFWFHAALGGVEVYQEIASKSRRPFWGIQARGWMTDRTPLPGIAAMASYYTHIIQSVQPAGPYDLGGLSLGGILAYEVTRQLQELGQAVNSIVMLDSMYCEEMKGEATEASLKTYMLQSVNIALLNIAGTDTQKIFKTLVHRDEVDSNLSDEAYFEQLVTVAQARGLTKLKTQMNNLVEKTASVQSAYGIDSYEVTPLPDPEAVTCYYFRNRSGRFQGDFAPYLITKADEVVLDNTQYWAEWENQIPDFHMMSLDSTCHFRMLAEEKPRNTITEFCETLYSQEKMSSGFLASFKESLKEIHGSQEAPI